MFFIKNYATRLPERTEEFCDSLTMSEFEFSSDFTDIFSNSIIKL